MKPALFIFLFYFLSLLSSVVHARDDSNIFDNPLLEMKNNALLTQNKTQEKPTVNFAILVYDDPEVALKHWQTMRHYLEQKLPQYHFHLTTVKADQLDLLIKEAYVDFFISNPVEAIQYKSRYGSSELLTAWPVAFNSPTLAMGSAAVAKKSLQLNNWQELSQYHVISTNPRAFGGYLIFANELSKQGINLQKVAHQFQFVDLPQEYLLQLVAQGDADIAVVPTCVLEQSIANGSIQPDQLHVLLEKQPLKANSKLDPCAHSTDLLPYYSLSKLGSTSNQISLQVVTALLENPNTFSDHNNQEIKWIPPVDNSKVYELLKQLQLWPFVPNWQLFTTKFGPLFTWLLVVLLLGYIYHLHIKRLVSVRTSELCEETTKHQETQRKLVEQQHQFYKAQRILLTGEMASGIAHELNQPLASIHYLAQGCQYRLKQVDLSNATHKIDEINNALEKVITQVDRAQSTIQRLRKFCQQPSSLTTLDLKIVIEELLLLMTDDLKQNKILLTTSLQPLFIEGDSSLLQQVIVNLIRNSIDAMAATIKTENTEKTAEQFVKQNRLTLLLKQNISLKTGLPQVHLMVVDNGIGMTKTQIERLFFPFETSKQQGLGLGMVICKRIIEEHNGQIWAEHNFPGVTIHVTLPMAVDTPCDVT